MDGQVIVETTETDGFTNEVKAGAHALAADEPTSVGGADEGPNPYEYLLAALGACTSMTLRMYAKRKGWSLDHVEVKLRHGRIHAKDCEDCASDKGLVDEIFTEVRVEGDLDEEQQARLMEIAERCPVHKTLTTETKIRMSRGGS